MQEEDETWREWLDRVADAPHGEWNSPGMAVRDFALNLRDAIIREEEELPRGIEQPPSSDAKRIEAVLSFCEPLAQADGSPNFGDCRQAEFGVALKVRRLLLADMPKGGWDAKAIGGVPLADLRHAASPLIDAGVNPSSIGEGWWADAKRAADQASEAIGMELVTGEMSAREIRAAALQAAYYVNDFQPDAAGLIANARKLEEYIRNG